MITIIGMREEAEAEQVTEEGAVEKEEAVEEAVTEEGLVTEEAGGIRINNEVHLNSSKNLYVTT